MRVLLSTGSLGSRPIREVFYLAKEAGFDGCEFVVGKNFNRPAYENDVAECVNILPIYSIHAPYVHIAAWGDEKQALIRCIKLARELGAGVVTFHPPSWLGREFKFYKWFKKVQDFQKEFCHQGCALSIENMPLIKLVIPPYILNNYKRLIRFGMEKNLYFTYDITHIGTYGHDIVEAFLTYYDTGRLQNIHISDYSLWREKSHLGIGRGELPIVKLLNTARRVGYDRMVTLEIAPQELPKTNEWLLKVMTYSSFFLKLHIGQKNPDANP